MSSADAESEDQRVLVTKEVLKLVAAIQSLPIVPWPGTAQKLSAACVQLNSETLGASVIGLNEDHVLITDFGTLQGQTLAKLDRKVYFETDESCMMESTADDNKPVNFSGSFEVTTNPDLTFAYDRLYAGRFAAAPSLPRPFLFQTQSVDVTKPFFVYRNDYFRTRGLRVPLFVTEKKTAALQSIVYDKNFYTSGRSTSNVAFMFQSGMDYKECLGVSKDGVCEAVVNIPKGAVLYIVDGGEDIGEESPLLQTQLSIHCPHDRKKRMNGVFTDLDGGVNFHWWTRLLPPKRSRPFDFHAVMLWTEGSPYPYLLFLRDVFMGTRVRVMRAHDMAINPTLFPAQRLPNKNLWMTLLALPVEESMRDALEKSLGLFFLFPDEETNEKAADVSAGFEAIFGDQYPMYVEQLSSGTPAAADALSIVLEEEAFEKGPEAGVLSAGGDLSTFIREENRGFEDIDFEVPPLPSSGSGSSNDRAGELPLDLGIFG